MYIIDSDTLISLVRGQHGVQQKMVHVGLSQCKVSEISLAELYVDAYKRNDIKGMGQANYIAQTFEIVRISSHLEEYAKLRAGLERQGCKLDSMDLFIAASALAEDLTLVTHNTKHFSRVPGLKLEDWIQDE